MAKQKQRIALGESSGAPFHNPFAKLTTSAPLPAGPAPQPVPEPRAPVGLEVLIATCRPTLRVERKGRGGKTVTLLGGLSALPEEALQELAARLKKGLGTGVSPHTEGDAQLLLQGDQTERARAFLDALKQK